MDDKGQFRHLRVGSRHPDPLAQECRLWAGHPAARWFLADLEGQVLDSLLRMERLDPSSHVEVAREQGLIKGLRMAIGRLEEVRQTKDEEEEE